MFEWFKSLRRPTPHRPPQHEDDWITVPFRYLESLRVSLYTVGTEPQVPLPVRWWISTWLGEYNNQLIQYMRHNYGEDIFPILDRITREVMPQPERPEGTSDETWEKWESQFKEGDS
jgi:hypothetical protein